MVTIGFDTSNYTTSVAYYNGTDGINCSQLLPVKSGELGLRQSDAVFHHTKSLPELSDRLFSNIDYSNIKRIGVSTRPRAIEGSYMPCFLVGFSHAKMLSDVLHIPLFEYSHQQGHIAAALWSAGRLDLLHKPHLAWHLSGGTTELLLVEPVQNNINCTQIGGTTDISAGQLIDRTGIMLDLSFPAGKHLDALSKIASNKDAFKIKTKDLMFSLSGIQNKAQDYYKKTADGAETAAYILRCLSDVILRTTCDALKQYPGIPVVFSGGVASNSMLRDKLSDLDPIFAQPQYSTDNAMGVAILAYLAEE